MLKKILFIIVILVLSSFSVFAATYRIDEGNDGNIEYVLEDVDNLQWRVYFATWGSQEGNYTDDSNLPRLTVVNESGTIMNFTSEEQYTYSDIPDSYQKQWFAIWFWNSTFENFQKWSAFPNSNIIPLSPGTYDFNIHSHGNPLSREVIDFWKPGEGKSCSNYPREDCPAFCNDTNPNGCSYNNDICGWTCNGITVLIYFYNGTTYLSGKDINSNNWPGMKYSYRGYTWLTASDPSYVNVQQTLAICADECSSLGETGCNTSTQRWACVSGADGCYHKDYAGCGAGKICVGGECIEQLTGAYWANMMDVPINQTNLSDRVKLMVPGSQIEGVTIEYQIYREIPWWFDSREAQFSNIGFTTWRANETGDYYFLARIQGGAEEIDSRNNAAYGILTVLATEDNFPPIANITSPESGDIYFIGENVEINQTSYDIDDFIDYIWDLGDGNIRRGSTRDFANYSFVYSYGSSGQMAIKLEVKDERGLSDEDRISILVIDSSQAGKYIFAHIDKPRWGEEIEGYEISFNASSSYAIETTGCDGSTCTINCSGGNCPSSTYYGTPINLNGKRGNYSDMNFSWIFDDDSTYKARGVSGVWFYKTFGRVGEHWAKLTTYLADSIIPSGSTETQFSNYVNSTCSIDLLNGGKWVWWDDNGIAKDPLKDPGTCLDKDGGLQYPNCCPPGYACVDPNNDGDLVDAICNISSTDYCANIITCDSYPNQNECQNDTCGRGVLQPASNCGETINVNDICGSLYFTSQETTCKCEWNETAGKCFHVEGLKSTIYLETPIVHSCKDVIEHEECVDSLMNIKKSSTLILDPSIVISEADKAMCKEKLCPNYEGTIMCGKPSIALKFFNLTNLIVAIIIIIVIYFILVSRKKNKIKKQKKKKKI